MNIYMKCVVKFIVDIHGPWRRMDTNGFANPLTLNVTVCTRASKLQELLEVLRPAKISEVNKSNVKCYDVIMFNMPYQT